MEDEKKLKNLTKKLKNKTSILTEEEVELLTVEVERFLGPEFVKTAKDRGICMGDIVRSLSLLARCEEARESRGLTFKDISSELKIPQYRLRDIEEGSVRSLKPEFAHRYFRYLGIESWVKRWARANPDLASRAGIIPFPK